MDSDDIINKIIPIIKTLISDERAYVRASLANSVLSLAPVLGKSKTNQHILGFFLTLLRDDDASVRINIFRNFHELTQVLPASTLIQSILPVFLELGSDSNWKHRIQCLDTLIIFEKEIGSEFLEDKQILKLLMDRLGDRIYIVR